MVAEEAKTMGIDLELAERIMIGFLEKMDSQETHPATALFAAIKTVAILSVNCGLSDDLLVRQLHEVLNDTRTRFEKA
jgi:hypothetical protein